MQELAPLFADGAVFVQWSNGDTNPTTTFTMPSADVSLTAQYTNSAGRFTPVVPYRLLDTRVGQALVVASIDPNIRVRTHDKLKLALNPERMHLFDPQTEKAF